MRHAVSLLCSAGVGYARGFALNATDYDSNANEVKFEGWVSGWPGDEEARQVAGRP